MLGLNLQPRPTKFMRKLPPKHRRQVAEKIFALRSNPAPPDSEHLRGYNFRRADIGEYRIIYRVEEPFLKVYIIGKRNDDEVYKQLKRLGG